MCSEPERMLTDESCRRARLARDPRFDGVFFIGVLTTGIFCRSICPATPPKEKNVRYFSTAIEAANAGLRPCLRCRPDSAPGSFAWKGTDTTVERALSLIDDGFLFGDNSGSLESLAQKLGITSRYLRKLFVDKVGTSPNKYAQFRQLMFAKQLLHQTDLSMTQVGLAAGFTSIRRFNEVFQQTLALTPSALRKSRGSHQNELSDEGSGIRLSMHFSYRPPLNWQKQLDFYRLRMVEGMEWEAGLEGYSRSFQIGQVKGFFEAKHDEVKHRFNVTIHLADPQALPVLSEVVAQIKRVLDLDADMFQIQTSLSSIDIIKNLIVDGLRLPGTWSAFEAGCRAILGQQVSVVQATKLLNRLVEENGERLTISGREVLLFPTPLAIASASLDELKMPGARKAALNAFGAFVSQYPDAPVDDWLNIKGIGPWTVAYAKMRGLSDPNILLCSDLIVKKRVLKRYEALMGAGADLTVNLDTPYKTITQQLEQSISPWGSYLTFQLWNLE
ncbi:DNA-3-methyladenine glycosylase 2 family protein [Shewanella nanhaiensis]|uniref:DNA-3-methyladenine glycosylase II n=1 Tax=Shewanella nanhaiensis TaxID=2864872 RepID=A0ABS7EBS5_9GAMM|nr:AlkA N-terminal domain-containing protein [Shewanella nanhaiensis]MBW8186537.1 helix-turn-helix domain-containing protein [Shewanella nanhaiensis]